jgi:polysaccharide biosynthesis transport protein
VERDDVISLQDYLVVLRRQRWLLLTTTVLVVVVAVGVSFAQTPLYESQAEVVVEPIRRTQDVSLEDLLAPSGNTGQTERLVMTSRQVAERAAEEVGTTDVSRLLDQVRAEAVADTRVVRVIATDPDPDRAAAIADAFTEGYLDLRRDQAVAELLAARSNLEDRAADLRAQIEALEGDAEAADDAADDDADDALGASVQRDVLISQFGQVTAQIAELGDAAQAVTGGGAVLTPAEIPTSPVSPRPLRTGALAVVLGLLLGVGVGFLRDHLDDVVRDETDFKRSTGGRPLLGRIPTWNDPQGGDRLVTVLEPSSIAGEAYRELSAGVRFLLLANEEQPADAGEHIGRSVILTSGLAGDGKTSTAANLAVAAARVGLRTVLVDADLRRPTLGTRFGLGRTTGLSDVLLSGDPVGEHVVRVGIDNLVVLTAGTIPPNPNELLASPAMRGLHQELTSKADLVVYDTPAALAVPDALELGRLVDLTILVGRAGVTGRRQLATAIERLEQAGTSVDGTVLNDIDSKGEGYYYAYAYVSADGAEDADRAEAAAPATPAPSRRAARRGKQARKERGATRAERSAANGSVATRFAGSDFPDREAPPVHQQNLPAEEQTLFDRR